MKKPDDRHNRRASGTSAAPHLRAVHAPAFDVSDLASIDGSRGALKGVFDVTLAGVVLRKCRILVNARGQAWIAGPTTPDRFSPGGYRIHADFDPELAAAILEVVTARLAAEEAGVA